MKRLCSLMLLLAVGGCVEGDGVTTPVDEAVPFFGAPQFSRALPRPQTWVNDELFNGVVTPAGFDPRSESFDELYTGGNGFLDGVPLISESGPGDQDYNGGRWHLNLLREGVDPDKYVAASSVEDLDLDDFMSTDTYFECPLLPVRRRN